MLENERRCLSLVTVQDRLLALVPRSEQMIEEMNDTGKTRELVRECRG